MMDMSVFETLEEGKEKRGWLMTAAGLGGLFRGDIRTEEEERGRRFDF